MFIRKPLACVLAPFIFIAIPMGYSLEDEVSAVDELISCEEATCITRNSDTENNTDVHTSRLLSEDGFYNFASTEKQTKDFEDLRCSSNLPCSSLPAECILCKFNYTCVYGQALNVTCNATSRCKVLFIR